MKEELKFDLKIIMLVVVGVIIGNFILNFSFVEKYVEKNILIDNEKIRYVDFLNDRGYEVFAFYDSNGGAYVKMKSLGSRRVQVENSLDELSLAYSNSTEYTIRILEETRDCWYLFQPEEIVSNDYISYSESELLDRGVC